MKALTVCQPYAELLVRSRLGTKVRHKMVENREWYTNYRGWILLHAGKSRDWLGSSSDEGLDIPSLTFGGIIGAVYLADCLHIDAIERGDYDHKYPWLRDHEHTNGTYCWVMPEGFRINPISCSGKQGLWEYPQLTLGDVMLLKLPEGVSHAR